MATRNVFRFVSVRPPISAAEDGACRLINMEAGEQFVANVSAWQREHAESLEVARRAVSVELLESAEYFVRSDVWKDLRPLRKPIQDLVARMCRTDDGADEAAPGENESTIDEEVRRWVVGDSDSFADARFVLWRSYFANALAPELRPNDRPEMLDWIRIMASLERLRPPADDADWRYDEESCACVERLNRARVNMPYELFNEMPPSDPVPDKPKDPVDDDIVDLRASLGRLKAARRDLDLFYRRKINALRMAPEPDREHRDAEAAPPQPAEGGDDLPVVAVAGEFRDFRPPWILTEEDAEQLADVGAELHRLGVPLAGSLLPEVTGALDDAIAAETSALLGLESRVDVVGAGETMAAVRRTVRGFGAARRDGAGSTVRDESGEQDGEAKFT